MPAYRASLNSHYIELLFSMYISLQNVPANSFFFFSMLNKMDVKNFPVIVI